MGDYHGGRNVLYVLHTHVQYICNIKVSHTDIYAHLAAAPRACVFFSPPPPSFLPISLSLFLPVALREKTVKGYITLHHTAGTPQIHCESVS